jgi:hypothetical protein
MPLIKVLCFEEMSPAQFDMIVCILVASFVGQFQIEYADLVPRVQSQHEITGTNSHAWFGLSGPEQ